MLAGKYCTADIGLGFFMRNETLCTVHDYNCRVKAQTLPA